MLSGFVASLSDSGKDVVDIKSYFKYIAKRIRRFYSIHLIFLLAALPLNYYSLLHDTKIALLRLLQSVLLLQSWNSDSMVFLGYNGVAWFLSTSVFLTVCTPFIYRGICVVANNKRLKIGIIGISICFAGMLVCAGLNQANEGYWLYAFPPSRLFDYLSGYLLAEIFKMVQNDDERTVYNSLWYRISGIMVIAFYIIYLTIFPYVDVRFRRAAIYLPGAVFTIWNVAREQGFLSKLLARKELVKLGDATLYFMLCHQIILKYAWYILKYATKFFDEKKLTSSLVGRGIIICSLFFTIVSYPIYKRMIKNISYRKKARKV